MSTEKEECGSWMLRGEKVELVLQSLLHTDKLDRRRERKRSTVDSTVELRHGKVGGRLQKS